MPAGNTFKIISSTTVPNNTSQVQLTNFGGYTDLIIVMNPTTDSTDPNIELRVNGDTSGTWSGAQFYGQVSTGAGDAIPSETCFPVYVAATSPNVRGGMGFVQIPNYANSTTFKWMNANSFSVMSGGNVDLVIQRSFVYRASTNAITTIELKARGAGKVIVAGSVFTVYGILAA